MKLAILGWSIALWFPQHLTAATVLLQFDSIVESVEFGPAPPVGTPLHVRIFYETPNLGGITSYPKTTGFELQGMTTVTVDERVYSMRYMLAFIGADSDAVGWRLHFVLRDFLSPSDDTTGMLDLFFGAI